MNTNPQPIAELQRLFRQPAAGRTVAHECAHPGCDRLTLRELCDRHRAAASVDTEAGA